MSNSTKKQQPTRVTQTKKSYTKDQLLSIQKPEFDIPFNIKEHINGLFANGVVAVTPVVESKEVEESEQSETNRSVQGYREKSLFSDHRSDPKGNFKDRGRVFHTENSAENDNTRHFGSQNRQKFTKPNNPVAPTFSDQMDNWRSRSQMSEERVGGGFYQQQKPKHQSGPRGQNTRIEQEVEEKPKSDGRQWFYRDRKDRQHGPFSSTEMRNWVENGLLEMTFMLKMIPKGKNPSDESNESFYPLSFFFDSEQSAFLVEPNDPLIAVAKEKQLQLESEKKRLELEKQEMEKQLLQYQQQVQQQQNQQPYVILVDELDDDGNLITNKHKPRAT
eukprot:c20267_g2_i1.p1 GENE.c20267_g2_i1~~c20267_g2_i1.p1  ORF type:complete len:332 (+),score=116.05 c20267_g2_i1:72-1067(+)